MILAGLMTFVYNVSSFHGFGVIFVFLLSFFTLLACGRDPILDRVDEMSSPSQNSASPKNDRKDPPRSSSPSPGDPPPAKNEKAQPNENDGPRIFIRGVITSEQCPTGPIRLNVSNGIHSEQTQKQVKVLGELRNIQPGPFEIQIEASNDNVYIDAFCDLNKNNKPEDSEPKAVYQSPLKGNSDHSDLQVVLKSQSPQK